jgi:hypothetical protein
MRLRYSIPLAAAAGFALGLASYYLVDRVVVYCASVHDLRHAGRRP